MEKSACALALVDLLSTLKVFVPSKETTVVLEARAKSVSRQVRRRDARRAAAKTSRMQPPQKRSRHIPSRYPIGAVSILLCMAIVVIVRLLTATNLPKPLDQMTALDLISMNDKSLAHLDPLVMNLIVARSIPGLEDIDISKYTKTVDEWAKVIDNANKAAEPTSKGEATYKVSREFWMAGGMAVMFAGPRFGISYTSENLDAAKSAQQFIYGIIDHKQGTCATMPVLYLAIGHRLGWPIKGVVSRDHMWARWDDGVPAHKGGKRFNLEATNAKSNGAEGSFASLTDQEYADWLKTPPSFIESGSDMTSLTPRQLLGVFLQARAGYWRATGNHQRQREDLALALKCFPENIDIKLCYESTLNDIEIRRAFRLPKRIRHQPAAFDAERFNRENIERLQPAEVLQQPVHDPFGILWNNVNLDADLQPSR